MKKRIVVCLVGVLLLAGLLGLAAQWDSGKIGGGSGEPGGVTPLRSGGDAVPQDGEHDEILLAKVIKAEEKQLLLCGWGEDAGASDLYWATTENVGRWQPGEIVKVYFNGSVKESYPAQIGGFVVSEEQGDDLVGLYRRVIDDLRARDPGLADGIDYAAFDWSQWSSLNPAEQAALAYLIGCGWEVQTLTGSYDELVEQGYIVDNFFEKGVLLSVQEQERAGAKLRFDASMWRSGLGAYFFSGCTATQKNGVWSYQVEAEAIS